MPPIDKDATRVVEPNEPSVTPAMTDEPPAALARGTQLGRYVILDPAGAGGMGEVYAAYDPELDRKVALKLLPRRAAAGEAENEAEARLLREAQAMAKLSHPNVVAVYDVGTAVDRVYIAMELIDGTTLRQWSRAGTHAWREVLAVMLAAARGLAAAHRAGIVHRDFKPSNVMIRRDGEVRVLDFGLARQLESTSTSPPENECMDSVDISGSGRRSFDVHLTRTGMVTGTPAYMAPEQFTGHDLDARADQFAYCITLWEALYGERPFAGDKLKDIAREVHRGRIRQPPSGTRVPPRLRKVLMRGLLVDPDARHPSMDALIAALERVVSPRWRRTLPLFAGGVGMSALALALALPRASSPCEGGADKLAGVWDEDTRGAAERAFAAVDRPYVATTWARVQTRLDEYAEAWVASHRDACEATAVRAEQSDALLDRRMACLDDRLAELRAMSGVLATADAAIVEKAIDATGKLGDLGACEGTALLDERIAAPSPEIAADVATERAELARAKVLAAAGKWQEGLPIAQAVVERARTLAYEPLVAEALQQRGALEMTLGKGDAAEATLTEALLAAERTAHDAVELRTRVQLASVTGLYLARADDGRTHLRFAEALAHRVFVGNDQVGTIALLHGLLAYRAGDNAGAITHMQRAIEEREAVWGPDHPEVAGVVINLGAAQVGLGRYEDALATFERGVAVYRSVHGDEHPLTGTVTNNLALAHLKLRHYDEALALNRRALEIWKAALPENHPDIAKGYHNVGVALANLERYDEALASYEAALAAKLAALGPNHPSVAVTRSNIGDLFNRMGRHAEALPHAEQALGLMTAALGAEHLDAAAVHSTMGRALVGLGRIEEGRASLEKSIAIWSAQNGNDADLAETRFALARLLWRDPNAHEEAKSVARASHDGFAALGAAYAEERDRTAAWLQSPSAAL